jgi:carbon starvation protein
MNMSGAPETTVAQATAWNFPVTVEQMTELARENGEQSLFGRTGGAATLAVGMAQIFSKVTHGHGTDLWYHFAIMFEALFILTTIDAGTRVGRYLLQDMLGNIWKPLGETQSVKANVAASALVVGAWGYFLIQGVRDELGGIQSLWPLFGIANQMLAGIALSLVTTIILKQQLARKAAAWPALVTLIPLTWLIAVTMTAGYQKIFHDEPRPTAPRIGFLQIARELEEKVPALTQALEAAKQTGDAAAIKAATDTLRGNRARHFNNLLDAWVAGVFMLMVLAVLGFSVVEWCLLLASRKPPQLRESEPVWLPDYAAAETRPGGAMGAVLLGCALAKELSGESQLERVREQAMTCECKSDDAKIYLKVTKEKFNGVRRCC